MADTISIDRDTIPRQQQKSRRMWTRIRRGGWGYIFVFPWILVYLVFGLYPLLLSFYLTFFTYSFVTPEDYVFVGLGNWLRGFLDPLFWKGITNIFYNQVIFILVTNVIGLLTAFLLYKVTFAGRIFRTIYFMPVITSVVVLMVVGNYLTSPQGPIQSYMVQLGILDSPVFWKFTESLPMPVIALINSWKWFGVSTVIYLAGLYAVDPQFYEAAQIDGASGWQQFWSITIPQLRPQIFFLLVVNVINGLQMFTEVFTLGYDVFGGPQHQALTPVLYLYAQAFNNSNIGYASTLGLLLALVIALLTVIQFRLFPSDAR